MKTECILVCGDVAKSIPVSGWLKLLPPTTIPFNGNRVVAMHPQMLQQRLHRTLKNTRKKPNAEHKWNGNQSEFGQRAPHTQRKVKQNN